MQCNTFTELEQNLFSSCEEFLDAARRVAALESVSLTITHKSRNTPGKTASQYRGCLVLNCIQWKSGCTFEIKAYGPIDGGWRMRPLQHPGLKKHTVTSWCICDHPKVPLRPMPTLTATTWPELLTTAFSGPDEIIAGAMHVAAHTSVDLYLLTLMLSDGKPKPNGRDSTYIPRGFLTLECVEASNGCPFAIKCREEENGWFMRPWREKGKGDLKGAVSNVTCKHGPDVAAAHANKMAEKERKARVKSKAGPSDQEDGDVEVGGHSHSNSQGLDLHHHQQDDDIPSGLDPSLMSTTNEFHALSQEDLMGAIQHSINSTAHSSLFGLNDSFHFDSEPSTSSGTSYTPSVVDQFRSNLSSFPFVVSTPTPLALAPASTSSSSSKDGLEDGGGQVRAPKRARKNHQTSHLSNASSQPGLSLSLSPLGSLDVPSHHHAHLHSPSSNAHTKVSWKTFLETLDPEGRLNVLTPALTKDGGIDPGAVVLWPPNDVSEFVDSVAGEQSHGVRIHFRVLLVGSGKRIWDELTKAV